MVGSPSLVMRSSRRTVFAPSLPLTLRDFLTCFWMIWTVSRYIWTTCWLVAGSCHEPFSCDLRHLIVTVGFVSFVCNLLIRAVTDPHTCLTFLTLSPFRSSSVHVHVFTGISTILAHNPDTKLHLHRLSLPRPGLDILRLLAVVSTPG